MDDDDDVMIPGDDSAFLADVKARVTAILILEPDAGMSAQQFAQIYKCAILRDCQPSSIADMNSVMISTCTITAITRISRHFSGRRKCPPQ